MRFTSTWLFIWCTIIFPYFGSFGGIVNLRKYFSLKHLIAWKQLRHIEPPLDHVCIDLNQLLHSAYRGPYGENSLRSSLDSLFRITKPKKSIVLAVDGPPPFAKLYTCRSRRLKSADVSKYTPGTNLMRKFVQTISDYVHHRLRRYSNATVYLSAAEKAGEGELKILQYLHTHILSPQCNGQSEDKVLLVGGDSDLMLQALSLCQRMRNLVITQKTSKFKLTDEIFHPYSFYEDIVKKRAHYNTLQQEKKKKNSAQIPAKEVFKVTKAFVVHTDTSHVLPGKEERNGVPRTNALDIVLLFSLQGNDYFPKMRTTCMEKLLVQYFETAILYDTIRLQNSEGDDYFVSKEGKINYAFLYLLLDRWDLTHQSKTSMQMYYQNHLFPPSSVISHFSPSQYLIRHVQHAYRKRSLGFENGALNFFHRNSTFAEHSRKRFYYCIGVSVASPIPYPTIPDPEKDSSKVDEDEKDDAQEEEGKDVIWFDDCYFENKRDAKEMISIHIISAIFPELLTYLLANNYSYPVFRRYQAEKVKRLCFVNNRTELFMTDKNVPDIAIENGIQRLRDHLHSLESYAVKREDSRPEEEEDEMDEEQYHTAESEDEEKYREDFEEENEEEDEEDEEIFTGSLDSNDTASIPTATTMNVTDRVQRYLQGIEWYLEMYRTGICPDVAYHFFPTPGPTTQNISISSSFPFPFHVKEYLEDCIQRFASPTLLLRHADGSIDYHSTIQQPSIQRLLEELHVLTPPVLPSSSDDKDPTITHKFRALNEAETCVALIPRIGKDFVPANLKTFWEYVQKHYFEVDVSEWKDTENGYASEYIRLIQTFQQFYKKQQRLLEVKLPKNRKLHAKEQQRHNMQSRLVRSASGMFVAKEERRNVSSGQFKNEIYDHSIWTCYEFDNNTLSNKLVQSTPPSSSSSSNS